MSPKNQRAESCNGRAAPVTARPASAIGVETLHATRDAANNLKMPDLRVMFGAEFRLSISATMRTSKPFAIVRIRQRTHGSPIMKLASRLPTNRQANREGHSVFRHFSTTISRIALTGQTAATSPVPRVNRTAPTDNEQAARVNRA